MKKPFYILVLVLISIVLIFYFIQTEDRKKADDNLSVEPIAAASKNKKTIHFSTTNKTYRFSSEIPNKWAIEYIPETEAINIYDSSLGGSSNLEKSQIFIRNFRASTFLTLSTVDILQREETKISGHAAVRYEIEKKNSVPIFSNQPLWRSQKHKLIDIRFSGSNPTTFYVFAYNPQLDPEAFKSFIEGLKFHNDMSSFVEPIKNSRARVTEKRFGILVSPENSPINPEKFTGFHAGSDFETFEDEQDKDIPIYSICGGPLHKTAAAQGYGGVIVQDCAYNDQAITIIYGHIRLSSIIQKVGEYLNPGDKIAVLGKGFSLETDYERKHLHLAVRKGSSEDIRGYVKLESELSNWLDPLLIFR